MVSTRVKSIKIKLNNGTASGMYILINDDELKFTKNNETKPPNRIYKIEIAIETMYKNKRCRGKQTFTIPKGTSMVKAVSSLLGKKDEMIKTLKSKGTLKLNKIKTIKIDNTDRTLENIFKIWINNKAINSKPNTIRVYKVIFNTHLKAFWKKKIDDIAENDIQAHKHTKPKAIAGITVKHFISFCSAII